MTTTLSSAGRRGTPASAVFRGTVAVVVLSGAALLAAAAAAWTILTHTPEEFEVMGSRAVAAACGAAIVLLGIAAAAAALEPRGARRLRVATAVAMLSLSWSSLVPLVVEGAPAAVRLGASVIAAALPAALLHLGGALGDLPLPRWAVPTAYGVLGALAATRSLVTPPFLDVDCRVGCDAPSIVVVTLPAASHPLGMALSAASALTLTAAIVSVALALTADPRRQRPPRMMLAMIAAIAVVGLVGLLVPGGRPVLGPPPPLGDTVLAIESIATAMLAVGLLVRTSRRTRRVASLRTALEDAAHGEDSPSLQGVLARALKDPRLRLEFWLPTLGRWSDSTGAAPAGNDDAVRDEVTISRRGAVIARVRPGRTDADPGDLLSVIGSAAQLLIDNERLRVERLAQAAAVRESLLRIVETSDAARRQLERELHDGAQQGLLAAILAYRLAADELGQGADAKGAAAELDVVLGVLGSLRKAAQGVYPPVLADAGLLPALQSLARTARASVSLNAPSLARLDSSIEFTVYLAAREALERATDAAITISLRRVRATLVLELVPAPRFRTPRLADRVGALGGSIRRHDDTVIVEVPCA